MPNARSLANLRPPWKKGEVPNPHGRPKKKPITEAYERRMSEVLPDDVCKSVRLKRGSTWADLIALGMAKAAVKGRAESAREIADRVEGKATQPVEVTGENAGPVKWVIEVIGNAPGPHRPYREFQRAAEAGQCEFGETDGGEHEH